MLIAIFLIIYIIGYILCYGKHWGEYHFEYPERSEIEYYNYQKSAIKFAFLSWLGYALIIITSDFNNKYKFL